MTEEYKEIQITLTKEFHKKYWDLRLSSLKGAIFVVGSVLAILVTGVIFDALPYLHLTLLEGIIITCIIFLLSLASLCIGVYMGVKFIGAEIRHRIEEEHPELFKKKEDEK